MYYEITGCPGTGKSFSLKFLNLGKSFITYEGGCDVIDLLLFITFPVIVVKIRFYRSLWLFRNIIKLDLNFFEKVNLTRNVFKKFLVYYIFKNRKKSIVVDEGISHLPFILSLSKDDIIEFSKFFFIFLNNINVICVTSELEVNWSRLITRGHSKFKGKSLSCNYNMFVFWRGISSSINKIYHTQCKTFKVVKNV